MQPYRNTQKKPNQNRRKRKPWQGRPRKEPATVSPPNAHVQAEEWGSTAEPWPETIDESDVSKEIISVWRENVYAASHGGELRKMEELYDRLDMEREKWNERVNNPITWGWGAGQPDELNDWGRETREVTGWDTHQPGEHDNWSNNTASNPCQWGVYQQADSDRTQTSPSGSRSAEQTPAPLLELVSSYAGKLNPDGRRRSYAFARLSSEAKVEKIREIACQLSLPKKH